MYKSKTAEGSYLCAFFRLAFVDPDEIEYFFVNNLETKQPHDNKVKEFTAYVYNNYIKPNARFPPNLWAKFSAGQQMRANHLTAN